MRRICEYICPHVQDESYLALEDSNFGEHGACMLCDLRDMSHLAMVCKQWDRLVKPSIYRSIRIDAVHYCDLEYVLAEKRKRKSRFEHNGVAKDVPQERLRLLTRTVRENEFIGVLVEYFKMPYMTRETCKVDIARAVAALPNLKYVDLPVGVFSSDSTTTLLRKELEVRCLELRKMTFSAGSEFDFMRIASGKIWQSLEVVELSNLKLEMADLLKSLSCLPVIQELKINGLPWLNDEIFQITDFSRTSRFPPLQNLEIDNAPGITAAGLTAYLSNPGVAEKLTQLTLASTGVQTSALNSILISAPYLTSLSIAESVEKHFPQNGIPPFASLSLQTFNYLIISPANNHTLQKPAQSHYGHLIASLWSRALPALHTLFVRDANFVEGLLSYNLEAAWTQPLDIFSKADHQDVRGDWTHTSLGSEIDANTNPFLPSSPAGSRPTTPLRGGAPWAKAANERPRSGIGGAAFLNLPSDGDVETFPGGLSADWNKAPAYLTPERAASRDSSAFLSAGWQGNGGNRASGADKGERRSVFGGWRKNHAATRSMDGRNSHSDMLAFATKMEGEDDDDASWTSDGEKPRARRWKVD
jgi:hypothetical protein